jgi:hypothetical protein
LCGRGVWAIFLAEFAEIVIRKDTLRFGRLCWLSLSKRRISGQHKHQQADPARGFSHKVTLVHDPSWMSGEPNSLPLVVVPAKG